MHSSESWIQLGLKQALHLGVLLWELINFRFGLSHFSIISALATKKFLTTYKDTPVCVLYSHMTILLTRHLTLDVCWGLDFHTKQFSETPAGCPTAYLSSETIYLERSSDPTG